MTPVKEIRMEETGVMEVLLCSISRVMRPIKNMR